MAGNNSGEKMDGADGLTIPAPGAVPLCCRLFAEKESDRLKKELLSRMSHDMLTPLNAILGMAQIAKLKGGPHEVNECILEIEKASRHLLELILDLFEASGK